eukprot:Em0007g967a
MFTPLYRKLLSGYPSFRKVLWQWLYQNLAKTTKEQQLLFMNYGFASLDAKDTLQLRSEDEANRLNIQLYHHILSGLVIKDKDCLEVGSGRGGGVTFVAQYMKPKSVLGVELSSNAVDLSNRLPQSGRSNVSFIVGSAENLPVQSRSIDVVFNVESSHCYPNIGQFICEVRRVLRPGGHFAWADLQPKETMLEFDYEIQKSGMSVIKRENITPNVIKSLELMDSSRSRFINENAPFFMRRDLMNFMGTKDGIIYQQFLKGEMVYMHYQIQNL